MSQSIISHLAGSWLVCKLRRQQIMSGTLHAARLARKQGMPIELALRVFCGR